MHANTAKNISNNAQIQQAIREQLDHVLALIQEAAQEGKNEITLPYDYTLRSTSAEEFNQLIGQLKKEGFKPHFEILEGEPQDEGSHILDRFTVSLSWK